MSNHALRRTLHHTFDPRRNSLNALRMAFAGMVLVSHSFATAGRPEPMLGGITLGTWAVIGFFGISGFLITRSRVTARSAADYAEARAARILPALVVNLIVTAFVLAPVSLLFDRASSWDPIGAAEYVLRNSALYPPKLLEEGIPGTLANMPYPGVWNGSLWTLFWEGFCYVAIGVGLVLVPERLHRVTSVAVFVVTTAAAIPDALGIVHYPGVAAPALHVCIAFSAGSVAFFWADRIRTSTLAIAALVAVLVAAVATETVALVAPLPLVLVVLTLSDALPFHRFGSRFDASYGLYIYGFPVQQLTVLALGTVLPFPALLLLQALLATGFGYLSSWLVERPAQAWARDRRHRRAAASRSHEIVPARLELGTLDPR